MNMRLFSIRVLIFTLGLLPAGLSADKSRSDGEAPEASVFVECHGRLRNGVVAVGGETTGTTISFHRITWELQLPDEASRQFAEMNHKAPVTVTGRLRKVIGTEELVRWIVDVETLSAGYSGEAAEEGANITIRGTLSAKLATTGDIPDLSVRTDDQHWQLDFSADRATQRTAQSLISQHVIVKGSMLPRTEEPEGRATKRSLSEPYGLRVKSIEAFSDTAADTRLCP